MILHQGKRQNLIFAATYVLWSLALVQSQGVPEEESSLYGVWKGLRLSTGYLLYSKEESAWQAGCLASLAERSGVVEATEMYNITFEMGGSSSDLSWKYNITELSMRKGWTLYTGIERWMSDFEATIDNYTTDGVVYFTGDSPAVDSSDGTQGCQQWDVQIDLKKKAVTLTQHEVIELIVYPDGSLELEKPKCPTEDQMEPFCLDSREPQKKATPVVQQKGATLAVAVANKTMQTKEKTPFGYCATTPNRYPNAAVQVENGGSELMRCLDYLILGLQPLYQRMQGNAEPEMGKCVEIQTAAKSYKPAQGAVDCLVTGQKFFQKYIGDTRDRRQAFCKATPSCYVCAFCQEYDTMEGQQCDTCGGNAPAPPAAAPGMTEFGGTFPRTAVVGAGTLPGATETAFSGKRRLAQLGQSLDATGVDLSGSLSVGDLIDLTSQFDSSNEVQETTDDLNAQAESDSADASSGDDSDTRTVDDISAEVTRKATSDPYRVRVGVLSTFTCTKGPCLALAGLPAPPPPASKKPQAPAPAPSKAKATAPVSAALTAPAKAPAEPAPVAAPVTPPAAVPATPPTTTSQAAVPATPPAAVPATPPTATSQTAVPATPPAATPQATPVATPPTASTPTASATPASATSQVASSATPTPAQPASGGLPFTPVASG